MTNTKLSLICMSLTSLISSEQRLKEKVEVEKSGHPAFFCVKQNPLPDKSSVVLSVRRSLLTGAQLDHQSDFKLSCVALL